MGQGWISPGSYLPHFSRTFSEVQETVKQLFENTVSEMGKGQWAIGMGHR
jgi:hypothetical protein